MLRSPESKNNAGHVSGGYLALDILWFGAGVLAGVVAITLDFHSGAIYKSDGKPKRKRSGRFDATKAAQAAYLNEAFDDLPDSITDESRMRLLLLTLAYRHHRKSYGDNEEVNIALRRLENGLYFWNMEKGFPVGHSGIYEHVGGKGEPMVVVQAYDVNPNDRYHYRKDATTSIMPFSSITVAKKGLGGLAIPQMTGAKLTRRIPDDLHMEPRSTILGATQRATQGRGSSDTADAVLECGLELLGAATCQDLLSDVASTTGASLTCSAAQQLLKDGEIDAATIASDVILDKAGSLGAGLLFLLCVADRS